MRSKLHASNLVARFDCHTDSDHPMLTVKGHTVEDHLIHFARHYGVLGFFGEGGMEAEHPFDTRMRLLVRTIRNPKDLSEGFT